MTQNAERRTWQAMIKFAADKPLTDAEFFDLSVLTIVDRNLVGVRAG
jgi:hypothetical protein